MICLGGHCPRKIYCSRYCLCPQPKDKVNNRIVDLYVYGYGKDEQWLCGEYGNWGMFERRFMEDK